jgi:hypothetical protein
MIVAGDPLRVASGRICQLARFMAVVDHSFTSRDGSPGFVSIEVRSEGTAEAKDGKRKSALDLEARKVVLLFIAAQQRRAIREPTFSKSRRRAATSPTFTPYPRCPPHHFHFGRAMRFSRPSRSGKTMAVSSARLVRGTFWSALTRHRPGHPERSSVVPRGSRAGNAYRTAANRVRKHSLGGSATAAS